MIVLRRKHVIIVEMVFIWMKGSANVEKVNISTRIANHAKIAIKLSNFVSNVITLSNARAVRKAFIGILTRVNVSVMMVFIPLLILARDVLFRDA